MGSYSDTAQQVLNRVLEILESDLSAPALKVVKESIKRGTFENVDEVLSTIEQTSNGVDLHGNN
jgi:hypothetical protein